MANSIVHNHVPVQDLTLFKVVQPYEQMLREREKRLNSFLNVMLSSVIFSLYIYIKNTLSIYIFRASTQKISSQFSVLKDHFSLSPKLCDPC